MVVQPACASPRPGSELVFAGITAAIDVFGIGTPNAGRGAAPAAAFLQKVG